MRKSTLLGAAMAAALTITTVAVAAPSAPGGHHGHHGQRHGAAIMHMAHKLDLSDAQRASIKQIMRTNGEQNKGSRQALRQQRAAFAAMTPDASGYQAAATSLAQAEAQAAQNRVQTRANVRAQVYAVLTPAQRTQMATIKADAQARRKQWKQFRAEHPKASGQ